MNYSVLSQPEGGDALREMTMGRAVAETAFVARSGISPIRSAIATPSAGRRGDGAEAGFSSAVSTIPGIVAPWETDLHELPRIAWDGRLRSLRAMRVLLSGPSSPSKPPARGRRSSGPAATSSSRSALPAAPSRCRRRRSRSPGAGRNSQATASAPPSSPVSAHTTTSTNSAMVPNSLRVRIGHDGNVRPVVARGLRGERRPIIRE